MLNIFIIYMKNIYDKPLKVCSKSPLTGFTRSGYCSYDEQDKGKHLVCAKMDIIGQEK